MDDTELYKQFCFYGRATLKARDKCIGMLPEIYKRRIFEKHGFSSIYVMAMKIAGLSEAQVDRVLNLEKRLVDRPALHSALVKGEVSMNKLRRVVSISTVENQQQILENVKLLSARAVETMVRDFKQNGHVPMQETMFQEELQISDEVRKELLAMQKKGIDLSVVLKKLLKKYREEIELEKVAVVENLPTEASRYIPVAVKYILQKEFGDCCSVPGCGRKFEEIHHLLPYAMAKSHDPRLMVQLCAEHHRITHAVNLKTMRFRNFRSI